MSKLSTLDFEGQTFFIGIDVHHAKWVITIRTGGMELKTGMFEPSPEKLAKYLRVNYPGGKFRSVYEAGFCGFWIHRELIRHGIENIVVNPSDVPTNNKERMNKRDKVDSRKLSRELENCSLKGIYIPDEWPQQLRSLCRLRRESVGNMTATKNRIKGHLYGYGITLPPNTECSHWSGAFIKWIEKNCVAKGGPFSDYLEFCIQDLKEEKKRLAAIMRKIREYVKSPSSERIIRYLLTVPGIGVTAAVTVYTEIMDINRFPDLDRLCSFVGFVPTCHSSGDRESVGDITPRRNKYLRYIIIEAAWVAIRKDPVLLRVYSDLLKRMKGQHAIIRIAKKLLSRIRYVWKNQQPYTLCAN